MGNKICETYPRRMGKPINEDNCYLVCMTRRQVLAQSGVGRSRKSCFHHGAQSEPLVFPLEKEKQTHQRSLRH